MGALLLAAGLLAGLAAPAAAVEPFPLSGEITDRAGVLSADDVTEIQNALDRLAQDTRFQLYVVFVPDFSGADPLQWVYDTGDASGLSKTDDFVLAVSMNPRLYQISPQENDDISFAQVTEISGRVEDALRDDQWALAAVTAAEGLHDAATAPEAGGAAVDDGSVVAPPADQSTGPGRGGLLLVGIVAVGGAAVLVGTAARRRSKANKPVGSPDELNALPTDELDKRSASALVALDDAVRSSDEELGFAQAQFGQDATKEFAAVLADGRTKLTEAFRLRQALDDAVPDTEEQKRAWSAQILAICAEVSSALDGQKKAFDELRNLEDHVEQALDEHARTAATVTGRVGPARATLQSLAVQYPAAALASVSANPDQAERLLADATAAIGSGRTAAADAGHRGEAVGYARAAEAALDQARRLLDAVDGAGAGLAEAGARITAGIASITSDLADAARLAPGDATVAGPVAGARQAVEAATAAQAGTGDPLAAVRGLATAEAALDAALAPMREAEEQAQRSAALLDQALTRLDAGIRSVQDFVDTRRGVIGPTARTRLAEAQRLRDQAVAERERTPQQAVATAQRAQQMLDAAWQAAQDDVTNNQPPQQGPWGGSGGGSNNVGGMILGGLILGQILRGGGHGGGGWGGGGFGGGGFGGGGFGGGGGGGFSGGGGVGGGF